MVISFPAFIEDQILCLAKINLDVLVVPDKTRDPAEGGVLTAILAIIPKPIGDVSVFVAFEWGGRLFVVKLYPYA